MKKGDIILIVLFLMYLTVFLYKPENTTGFAAFEDNQTTSIAQESETGTVIAFVIGVPIAIAIFIFITITLLRWRKLKKIEEETEEAVSKAEGYIEQALKNGYEEAEIIKTLVKDGWEEEKAREIHGRVNTKIREDKINDLIDIIKQYHPNQHKKLWELFLYHGHPKDIIEEAFERATKKY